MFNTKLLSVGLFLTTLILLTGCNIKNNTNDQKQSWITWSNQQVENQQLSWQTQQSTKTALSNEKKITTEKKLIEPVQRTPIKESPVGIEEQTIYSGEQEEIMNLVKDLLK